MVKNTMQACGYSAPQQSENVEQNIPNYGLHSNMFGKHIWAFSLCVQARSSTGFTCHIKLLYQLCQTCHNPVTWPFYATQDTPTVLTDDSFRTQTWNGFKMMHWVCGHAASVKPYKLRSMRVRNIGPFVVELNKHLCSLKDSSKRRDNRFVQNSTPDF